MCMYTHMLTVFIYKRILNSLVNIYAHVSKHSNIYTVYIYMRDLRALMIPKLWTCESPCLCSKCKKQTGGGRFHIYVLTDPQSPMP